MKQRQSSSTAEGMALMRAIESARPEGARICYDPIARALVNPISYTLSKLFIDAGLYARIAPGTVEFIAARERYIDDFLAAGLGEGLDQVVILGAGFDTRAYRVPGIEHTRVFEVDHPATQAVKLKKVRKVLGELPAHVTYVAVDFNTQVLGERLAAGGYDEGASTLFAGQGLTVYLTAAGVDHTLAFIAGHSGPGSAVIFDYFFSEYLRDPKRSVAQASGPGALFGIEQGQAKQFLTKRGFREVRSADAAELKRLYLTGPNAGRPITTYAAIASARVGKPTG